MLGVLFAMTAHAGPWATLTLKDGFDVALEEDAIGVDGYGRPHIVWAGQDTVHHAVLDGTWSFEELFDPADLPGPALHATAVVRNQTVYAAWAQDPDQLATSLYWAEGSWGAWTVSPAYAQVTQHGSRPVINVAPDGTVQIADGTLRIQLLRLEGGTPPWNEVVPIKSPILGHRPDLAFDSSSTPHYLWEDGQEVLYIYGALAEQVFAEGFPVAPVLGPVSLEVDGNDQPVMGVHDGDLVKLYRLFGADWTWTAVDPALNAGQAPALSVDPGGDIHLAWVDTSSVRHAIETGPAAFTVEFVGTAPPGPVSIDATAGPVHLAHVADHALNYGVRDLAGAWTFERVVEASLPGHGVSALHDGTGVWMAHQDGGDASTGMPQRLFLTWSDGRTVTHDVEYTGPLYPDTELAEGSDGLLRFTRAEADTGELVLMTGTPLSWTLTVASRPGEVVTEHALALDPTTDQAVLAYLTDTDDLVVAYQDAAGGWDWFDLASEVDSVDVAASEDAVHVVWHAEYDPWYAAAPFGTLPTGGSLLPFQQTSDCGVHGVIEVDPKGGPRFVYVCEDRAGPFNDWEDVYRVLWLRLRNDGSWDEEEALTLDRSITDLAMRIDDRPTTRIAALESTGDLYIGDDGASGLWAFEVAASNAGGDIDLAVADDHEVFVAWQDPARWDLNLSQAMPELTIQPPSLDFGEVLVGESAELQFSVTNTGTTNYQLPTPFLEGPNPESFEVVGVCWIVMFPGTFCNYTIRFAPDKGRPRSATLSLAPGHEVPLEGIGIADTSGCSESCGCHHGGAGGGAAVLALLWGMRRRRCTP